MLSHPKEPITQTQVEALLSTLHNKSSPAKLEFSVHKQPSSIANAGLGVFLKGQCKAGEIVCLYPGKHSVERKREKEKKSPFLFLHCH
ncbi:hypothetical protein BDF14DRAFT_1403429 [Spinellus fusiger]|nr:hypothetical protein BDF14DRAFT_1403429 [Spinellus fusiger]